MSGTPILVRWLSQVPVSGKPGKREYSAERSINAK